MGTVIGALIVDLLVLAVGLPPLKRTKQYKEMCAYAILTTFAVIVYALQRLHFALPNPFGWIAAFFRLFGLPV